MVTHSSATNEFRKTAACPSSQTLLRFHRHGLAISDRVAIQIHLRACDFCNAELQLLMKHRGDSEESSCAKMPAHFRELAEEFLAGNRGVFTLRTDLSDRHRLSH